MTTTEQIGQHIMYSDIYSVRKCLGKLLTFIASIITCKICLLAKFYPFNYHLSACLLHNHLQPNYMKYGLFFALNVQKSN